MTIFVISTLPSVNFLYSKFFSPKHDHLLSKGSTSGQPLTTGPESDYLLIIGHSLPLSYSWLLSHCILCDKTWRLSLGWGHLHLG